MSLKAGIVGLPNVGKSTLFNAITNGKILAENYPFATIEPNVGIIQLQDKRLEKLSEIYSSKKIIYAPFEFIDIAGLVKGASKGEGLGNKFLTHIKECDCICHVVRAFDNDDIIHVEGSIDPIRDIEIINTELIFSDLEIVETRLSKIEKKAVTMKDKEALKEVDILKKIIDTLMQGKKAITLDLTDQELLMIKSYNLLTLKKMIYVANVEVEDLVSGDNKHVKKIKEYAEVENAQVITLCASIEAELSDLIDDEKNEFLNELGIEESGLNRLTRSAFEILGLRTFFTAGPEEARAWTFKNGMCAPACAGVIHTDFEKGFIKAEVISYEDLVIAGSPVKARENGKARLEGKDYIMKDADICIFRFNKS